MKLSTVDDIDIQEIDRCNYDIAILACGYEQRTTELAKRIDVSKIDSILTIHFPDHKDAEYRQYNESFFQAYATHNKVELENNEETDIYEFLNTYVASSHKVDLKILVDYTCMSRLWYAAIINWTRYSSLHSITLDFSYSIGDYKKDLIPLVIQDIHALPGHEGITTNLDTISVFGLGFDPLTTLCVLDKLEPNKIHSFVAIPVHKEYENKAEDYNKEFIENYSEPIQYYPLVSVEKTYRLMGELITPYRGEFNISFIPMGPKPHVLASILLSTKYNEVINLYVKGTRELPPNVTPNGDFICTRVTFSELCPQKTI